MAFDEDYRHTLDVFGSEPESLLGRYESILSRDHPVLDIGAGQGRNTFYLAKRGFRVDAIDPSTVAIDTIRTEAETRQLPVRSFACGFDTHSPQTEAYSGILIFGLIPVLTWDSIDQLVGFVSRWLQPGGLVFVTGFTIADDAFAKHARDWQPTGRNSFVSHQGDVRTYLEPNELRQLFAAYDELYYHEGLGPKHRHGDAPLHRHAWAEAVMQRPV